MQLGGNDAYRAFFDAHAENRIEGRSFEGCSVRERYDGPVGEEWKARLGAKVEGREYVPGEEKGANTSTSTSGGRGLDSGRATPTLTPVPTGGGVGGGMGGGSRTASPARNLGGGAGGGGNRPSKQQNEAYFAKMGAANLARPEDLPPSQGGKFAGFGSEPPGVSTARGGGAQGDDWLGDFGKDPMAGLTKGFGWLGKNARTGYDGWVRPNVQKVRMPLFSI